MGTRNLTVVVQNNEIKVAQYGQFDGYPGGQGMTALNFLRNMNESFREKVSQCSWISSEKLESLWAEQGASGGFASFEVAEKFAKLHPHLERGCAAEVLQLIQDSDNGLELSNKIDFAADSLFCEWAYVIDLDKNTFEVYKGFNQDLLSENERFSFLNGKSGKYRPVKLVKSYDLKALPTDEEFIEDLDPVEEE